MTKLPLSMIFILEIFYIFSCSFSNVIFIYLCYGLKLIKEYWCQVSGWLLQISHHNWLRTMWEQSHIYKAKSRLHCTVIVLAKYCWISELKQYVILMHKWTNDETNSIWCFFYHFKAIVTCFDLRREVWKIFWTDDLHKLLWIKCQLLWHSASMERNVL